MSGRCSLRNHSYVPSAENGGRCWGIKIGCCKWTERILLEEEETLLEGRAKGDVES